MRVALFTDSTAFSGTERHILDLAYSLQPFGVDAIVACPDPSPLASRARAQNTPVLAVPRSGLVDWRAAWQLKKLLETGSIDVLHAHNGRTAVAAALAKSWTGRGHFVASQHFLAPAHTTRRGLSAALFRQVHRWVNARIEQYIAISAAVGDEMLGRGDVPALRITVVPNGVRHPEANPLSSPEQIRAGLGMAMDTPLVCCVARLEEEKNISGLIQAMSVVHAVVPNAHCVIAGDGAQRESLACEIEHLRLGSSVRLLGFRDDALAVINAADLFVLPSLAEPSGLVILEAMALAKPVIATKAGGPREIVLDHSTGLLVPPGDAAALAAAITQLLKDPATASAMGTKGRQRYDTLFTAEEMARRTCAVYQQLKAGRAGQGARPCASS